jgi:hypothetical protein
MIADYEALIDELRNQPPRIDRAAAGLPQHVLYDGGSRLRTLTADIGVDVPFRL